MEVRRRPPKGKLAFLEGLRGIAALYVALTHILSMADPGYLAGRKTDAPSWLQLIDGAFVHGHIAVAAFIVISGFSLQLSLFAGGDGHIRSLGSYAKRRAKRILPPYYACLALSVLACTFVTVRFADRMPFEQYLPVTWQTVMAHVLLIHNWSRDWMYKINGVLWSIAIEAQLYLVFPLIIALLWKVGRLLTTAMAFAVILVPMTLFGGLDSFSPWYLVLFVMGTVAASFAFNPHPRIGLRPKLVSAFAMPAFLCGLALAANGYPKVTADIWMGAGLAGLLYSWTLLGKRWLPRLLSRPRLVWLGSFSYSLYLMHHPIEQVVYMVRPAFVEGPVLVGLYLLIVGLPLMVGGTYLFSLAFEKPFLNKKRIEPVADRKPPVYVLTSTKLKTSVKSG